MAEKRNPFCKLLETEVPINITSEMKEKFSSVNKALPNDACQLALKQPIPGQQLILMTDASFRSAGYILMIENNPDQKIQSKRKTYAPVAFCSKFFSPVQLKFQDVQTLKRIFGKLQGNSRFCTQTVGSNTANICSDRQQVRHTFLPNEGNSASNLDCMWLCVTI